MIWEQCQRMKQALLDFLFAYSFTKLLCKHILGGNLSNIHMRQENRVQISFIGSLCLLRRLHWWIILFIGPLCTTGIVWLLRVIFEGHLYDYSLASFPGDTILFIYLFCVGQICKREKLPQGFFFGKIWHWIIFLSAFIMTVVMYGLALTQNGARGRFTLLPANLYHFFVQLALSYAVSSSFPVIIVAKNRFLQCLAITCLLLYGGLLAYDVAMGNLSQHM